jgi:hypothetical protein
MKKYLFMFIAGIIFLNVWSVPEVSAQGAKSVRAEVAFDFYVGERVFPAGTYWLETISPASDGILLLRGVEKENRQLIFANSDQAGKKQTPKLIFRQIGGEYYLTNIFLTGGTRGYAVPPTRRQKEKGRNLASAKKVEVPAKN